DAIARGARRGVFSAQLHGMEHFWPACVMQAASTDMRVRDVRPGHPFPRTEALPAPLQSRWIDTTTLPSRALPPSEVSAAAREEVAAFKELLGTVPDVVVPSTFVWTGDAETAWT